VSWLQNKKVTSRSVFNFFHKKSLRTFSQRPKG